MVTESYLSFIHFHHVANLGGGYSTNGTSLQILDSQELWRINVVDFQSDYEYMLIAYNTKPTLLLKTTDKDKVQSKMSKIRMINGMVRTNLQRALDLAAYLLGNYSKRSITLLACSKPIMPLQFDLSGIDLKIVTPYTIGELESLNRNSRNPPALNVSNATQSAVGGNQMPPSAIVNGGVGLQSSGVNVQGNVQPKNPMMAQNQVKQNQMTGRQQGSMMNAAGVPNQHAPNPGNQAAFQQMQMQQQLNQQTSQTQQHQMGGNTAGMSMLTSSMNMAQSFQQPFDLQSNQFLESQKQQHQQHMARNNAIAGGNSNFLMNNMGNTMNSMSGMQMGNMNAMLAQSMMLNQQRPNLVNMNLQNQRQPLVIWNGHFSWTLNTHSSMQPVEIQCGVSAMSATHQQNPPIIDD
jgi:hypothetical protein